MTRKAVVRGPVLSSVVMVALASAATGLLAVIGFQALPESVVPSTFGADQHETRNVDVVESPTSVSTRKPSPTATGVTPTARETGGSTGSVQYPVRTTTRAAAPTRTATTPPKTTATTTAPKTTTPPKASAPPSASKSPSPSPSPCRPRKKCGKSYSSYDSGSDRTYATADTSTSSSTKKAKPSTANRRQKPGDKRVR